MCDEAGAGGEVELGYFRVFNLDFTLLQFDLGFFGVVLLF